MIENFLVGHGQKWVWPIWSLDSKIDCTEEWTDGVTDFLHVDTDSQKLEANQQSFGWA